jgi:hypothetical protein
VLVRDNELWKDGLALCNDYLTASIRQLTADARSLDEVLNTEEQFKSSVIHQSLNTAEANVEFEICLKLIDDWEKLWETQNETRERRRTSFIILSHKLLQFLRNCYHDRCIPCARCARLRLSKDTDCIFDSHNEHHKKRRRNTSRAELPTRHHNRSTLKILFGCSHHCRGGYCFFDLSSLSI